MMNFFPPLQVSFLQTNRVPFIHSDKREAVMLL